jgi:hypothetical protein
MEARTLGVTIERPWRDVYDALWRPQDFAKWASGLSQSSLEQDGEDWLARGPEGAVRIRFTPHNPFGVMDHEVELPDGSAVQVPLRVVPNGDGAEVILTLFRQPGMSDEKFAADLAWVRRDLAALQALFH